MNLAQQLRPVHNWPAGPPPRPLRGHLPDLARDELSFLQRCAQEFGDFVPLRFGPLRAALLNHPDMIEEVLVTQHRNFVKSPGYEVVRRLVGNGLVTSEGDLWRRQRRLMQPAFHRDRIADYARVMVEYTEAMMEGWRQQKEIDLHPEMTALTLAIVSKALFAANVQADTDRVGALVTLALEDINHLANRVEVFLPAGVPTPRSRHLRETVRQLDRIIYRLIAERRRSTAESADLLSVLLRASDEGEGMTDRQLRDEVMTLFLAGHETTAVALTWAWHLMAGHPETERKLEEEVDRLLDGRKPTIDDLPRLGYANAVMNESLRLFPPAPLIARQAKADCTVGPYSIPAGTIVLVSQWLIQRDARYFSHPDQFEPGRWLDGSTDRLPKFAYFPFGGGPRLCIGQAFAMTEGSLVLADMARMVRLKPIKPGQVAAKMTLTLRPSEPIRMIVSHRGGA